MLQTLLNVKIIENVFLKKVVICDIGVSSGQSSFELYKDLEVNKVKCIYGFDKQIYIKIYKINKFVFLFSSKKNLLMVEYNKNCLRYRYFLMFKKIDKFLFFMFNFLDIKFHSSTVILPNLNNIKKLKFFEQDIFDIKKKYFNFFDVIRISNLLNYSYFSEDKLKIAISNINKISKERCIIIVNRTTDKKKNLGSIFIKKKNKFVLLEDINEGSEVKKLILSFE